MKNKKPPFIPNTKAANPKPAGQPNASAQGPTVEQALLIHSKNSRANENLVSSLGDLTINLLKRVAELEAEVQALKPAPKD